MRDGRDGVRSIFSIPGGMESLLFRRVKRVPRCYSIPTGVAHSLKFTAAVAVAAANLPFNPYFLSLLRDRKNPIHPTRSWTGIRVFRKTSSASLVARHNKHPLLLRFLVPLVESSYRPKKSGDRESSTPILFDANRRHCCIRTRFPTEDPGIIARKETYRSLLLNYFN